MIFAMIASVLIGSVEAGFGEAPPETVSLPQLFSEFSGWFDNCRFDANQDFELISPKRTKDRQETQIKAALSSECAVINTRTTIHELDLSDGKKVSGEILDSHVRWKAGQSIEQIILKFTENQEWPIDSIPPLNKGDVRNIVARKKQSDPKKQLLGRVAIADFVLSESNSGLSLAAIAAGQFGYRVQSAFWSSEDRSSKITYVLDSPDYGIARVTCIKIDGRWFPSRIGLERLAQQKMVADDQVPFGGAAMNRVSMYDARKAEFNTPLAPIAKLERIYEMSYELTEGIVVPEILSRVEIIHRGIENVKTVRTVAFKHFHRGEVTCETVSAMSVTLPDGILGAVEDDPKSEYATLDNKLVLKSKAADPIGLDTVMDEVLNNSSTSTWGQFGFWSTIALGVAGIGGTSWLLIKKKSM